MSSSNSLLSCPDSFVEVVEYLIYHKLYTAAQIVQDAVTSDDNANMPWNKYRVLYQRIRLSVLENALEEPNSPMGESVFSFLKHLALYHYKRKTEEYLYLLKELAYLKLLYHVKKTEIDVNALESELKFILGDNSEFMSVDEDLENPLQDLGDNEINEFKNDFYTLLDLLKKGNQDLETIPMDKLDNKTQKYIRKLISNHKFDDIAKRFRQFLNPIKESLGEPFLHLINKDIRDGYYKPRFTEIDSTPSIPEHLKNKKANPVEILNFLSPKNRNEFRKYLEERNIPIAGYEKIEDDHDSIEETASNASNASDLFQLADEVDMENEQSNENIGESYQNEQETNIENNVDVGIEEEDNNEETKVNNNVDLMLGKLRSYRKQ